MATKKKFVLVKVDEFPRRARIYRDVIEDFIAQGFNVARIDGMSKEDYGKFRMYIQHRLGNGEREFPDLQCSWVDEAAYIRHIVPYEGDIEKIVTES